MKALVAVSLAALLCGGCSFNMTKTPTYESEGGGVARLYETPHDKPFKNLGLHAWAFYRFTFSEPTLGAVWPALSDKVRALGGNACVVRFERRDALSSQVLQVTCEVISI